MTRYEVYIGLRADKKTVMFLQGNETPREIAQQLVDGGFIPLTDFDEGLSATQFYPDSKTGEIILTDNSGYPYAKFRKAELEEPEPQTFGAVETQLNEKIAAAEQASPACPTCGSHNIRKIGYAERGFAAGLFGFVSPTARSQFECKDCGYKW